MLHGHEAVSVLRQLLDAHPEIAEETEGIALAMLNDVSADRVADQVEATLRGLALEDLYREAGEQMGGYVEPVEAAWELLVGTMDPFVEEVRRRVVLGLDHQALEACKGVVWGLYRVDVDDRCEVLDHAPYFAGEYACTAIQVWRRTRRPRRSASTGAVRPRRTFPRDFAQAHLPEWEAMVAQA